MKILAVDTSCATATCAVVENGKVLGETSLSHTKTHSTHLVPMIQGLMQLLGLELSQINGFAVAVGPGSFTGLRIGVSTMKTLAYAQNMPLVGISALMAQVHAMPPVHGLVCPLIDARNQQVFTALFRNDPEIVRLNEEAGIPVVDLAEQLKQYREEVLLIGDAAEMYAEMLRETTDLTIRVASSKWFTPRAASVALLAEKEFAKGGHENGAFDVNPHYLRKSQAERLKKQPGGEATP